MLTLILQHFPCPGIWTHKQQGAVWPHDVRGVKTKDPRDWQECQTIRKTSMKKTSICSSCCSDSDTFYNLSAKSWCDRAWMRVAVSPAVGTFPSVFDYSSNLITILFHLEDKKIPNFCRIPPTSARFNISHLLRIFMAKTLSVFFTFTTATCNREQI